MICLDLGYFLKVCEERVECFSERSVFLFGSLLKDVNGGIRVDISNGKLVVVKEQFFSKIFLEVLQFREDILIQLLLFLFTLHLGETESLTDEIVTNKPHVANLVFVFTLSQKARLLSYINHVVHHICRFSQLHLSMDQVW